VVAFRHAAAGELIESGINGMLADPANDHSFEAAARALLHNPALMRSVGQQACHTANTLGWSTVVEKTETVFQKILLEQGTPYAQQWLLRSA